MWYHAAFTDFLEEFLGQGPRARVVVGGQEQKQQLVHAFCGCIGHLHKSRDVDNILNILGYCEDDLIFDYIILGVYVWLSWQIESSHLEDTHPFEVHKQEFTQCDVGVDTVFFVHHVVPVFGPRREINTIVDVVR